MRRCAEAKGFALTTLADELRSDPEALRSIWQVYAAAQGGWADPDPRPEPEAAMGYATFLRRLDELPRVPDAFVVARHGERIAGFAGSIGTAVHPDFRGRGLATALKARVALDASSRGIASLETATGSAAMIRRSKPGDQQTGQPVMGVWLQVEVQAGSFTVPQAAEAHPALPQL